MNGTEYLARTWTLVKAVCDRSTCTFTASRRLTDEPVIETGQIYYIGTAAEVPVFTTEEDGSETMTELQLAGNYRSIIISEGGAMSGLLASCAAAIVTVLLF